MGDECVYAPQFATYLRDQSLNLGLAGQESALDESPFGEYLRGWSQLVGEFGLENAAFATMALDTALHQAAASQDHIPRQDEAMAAMGQARQRIFNLRLLIELHELALESDMAAFRSLIESPQAGQVIAVQGEEHLLLLFEQAKQMDFSGTTDGLAIHDELLESVGPDEYWTEVYVDYSRRRLAIEALRTSMVESRDAETAELEWQDFQESTWDAAEITLTGEAPSAISLAGIRAYMEGHFALERRLLELLRGDAGPTSRAAPMR